MRRTCSMWPHYAEFCDTNRHVENGLPDITPAPISMKVITSLNGRTGVSPMNDENPRVANLRMPGSLLASLREKVRSPSNQKFPYETVVSEVELRRLTFASFQQRLELGPCQGFVPWTTDSSTFFWPLVVVFVTLKFCARWKSLS